MASVFFCWTEEKQNAMKILVRLDAITVPLVEELWNSLNNNKYEYICICMYIWLL